MSWAAGMGNSPIKTCLAVETEQTELVRAGVI